MMNDFYIGIFEDNYLQHAKGWTKQNALYTSRYFKNGKWYYVYPNDLNKAMASTVNKASNSTKKSGGIPYANYVGSSKTTTSSSSTKKSTSTVSSKSSSKKSSKKSSKTSSKKTKSIFNTAGTKKSSSSSSKAKKEKAATAKASSSKMAKETKQTTKQTKTVNGKKVNNFTLQNSTDGMVKALNNYEDNTKGYVLVNGSLYSWTKRNGEVTFSDFYSGKKLDYITVVNEVGELAKKSTKTIQVGKHKK